MTKTEQESEQMRQVRAYSENTAVITCLKSKIRRTTLELSELVNGGFEGTELSRLMREDDPHRFNMTADLHKLAMALNERMNLEKVMMNMGLGALIKDPE